MYHQFTYTQLHHLWLLRSDLSLSRAVTTTELQPSLYTVAWRGVLMKSTRPVIGLCPVYPGPCSSTLHLSTPANQPGLPHHPHISSQGYTVYTPDQLTVLVQYQSRLSHTCIQAGVFEMWSFD